MTTVANAEQRVPEAAKIESPIHHIKKCRLYLEGYRGPQKDFKQGYLVMILLLAGCLAVERGRNLRGAALKD